MSGLLTIVVVFSASPREVREWVLQLPHGSTVRQALLAAEGLSDMLSAVGLNPSLSTGALGPLGIWGKSANPDQALEPDDRVEIYRPLTVDPKVARRERFKKQGRRSAGLFAKKSSPMASKTAS